MHLYKQTLTELTDNTAETNATRVPCVSIAAKRLVDPSNAASQPVSAHQEVMKRAEEAHHHAEKEQEEQHLTAEPSSSNLSALLSLRRCTANEANLNTLGSSSKDGSNPPPAWSHNGE